MAKKTKKTRADMPNNRDSLPPKRTKMPPRQGTPAGRQFLDEAVKKAQEQAVRPGIMERPPGGGPEQKRNVSIEWQRGQYLILVISEANGPSSTADTVYFCEAVSQAVFRMTSLHVNSTQTYRTQIGDNASCGCAGWRYHRRCRHVAALTTLRQLQKV